MVREWFQVNKKFNVIIFTLTELVVQPVGHDMGQIKQNLFNKKIVLNWKLSIKIRTVSTYNKQNPSVRVTNVDCSISMISSL